MSDDEETFESTLEKLEQAREAGERDYFANLAELRARLARLQEAAAAAEAAAVDAAKPSPEPAPMTSPVPLGAVAQPTVGIVEPAAVGWPEARGFRGLVNAFARWLLRDYLETLDRRQQAEAAALADQVGEVQGRLREVADAATPLRDAIEQLGHNDSRLLERVAAVQESQARLHTLIESTRGVAGRLAEVVDLLEGGSEQLRLLADVKDAETLARATSGPVRRMDLLFDEVARQQEALLAELVGRRGELEALIANLRADAGR